MENINILNKSQGKKMEYIYDIYDHSLSRHLVD